MNEMYSQLQWLPRPLQTFSAELRTAESAATLGDELRSLASYALDLNQLTRLAKVLSRTRCAGRSLQPLEFFRLAILSNSTVEMIVPAIVATAARHGFDLEVIQPCYDQVVQEALTPDSKVNGAKPDAVLFALDYRALPIKLSLGDSEAAAATVRGVIGYLQTLRNGIRANSNAVCILQTFAPPAEPLFGNWIVRYRVRCVLSLMESTGSWPPMYLGSGDVLLDVAALAETVGLSDWHDPQLWNLGKFAFSDQLIPLYADHVATHTCRHPRQEPEGPVLDLDNTVWGGVIGDDGLEGIKIAQGDATGEAHLAVQRIALDLRQRGIVLAVSSKNTDEMAREPFEKHPEMLLKLRPYRRLSGQLERQGHQHPGHRRRAVAGPRCHGLSRRQSGGARSGAQAASASGGAGVTGRSCLYARTLAAAGYFEAVAFAGEDLKRADFYQDNAKRANSAKAGRRCGRLPGFAGYDHHLPAFRRDRPRAHRAADQQVQPVQPDHAPLYRSRGGRSGEATRKSSPCRSGSPTSSATTA